jgi:hypothetical protein
VQIEDKLVFLSYGQVAVADWQPRRVDIEWGGARLRVQQRAQFAPRLGVIAPQRDQLVAQALQRAAACSRLIACTSRCSAEVLSAGVVAGRGIGMLEQQLHRVHHAADLAPMLWRPTICCSVSGALELRSFTWIRLPKVSRC